MALTKRHSPLQDPRWSLATAAFGLTIMAFLACVVIAAPATVAQTPSERPRVQLTQQTPFVGPADTFTLRLRVTGAPADARLSFRLYDDASSQGRLHYLRTLRGDELGAMIHQPYTIPTANMGRNEDGTVTAAFQIDSSRQPFIGFRLTDEGVYPLQVALQAGTGKDLDAFVTPLIRLPSLARNDNPPLAVSMVVPLDAPVALKTDGELEMDPATVKGLNDTIDSLVEHPEVPLSVAPLPETLVSLQRRDESTGSEGPSRLKGALAGRQVLASPYVRLDLGAFVNDGMNEELSKRLNAGTEAVATLLGARPDRRTWMITDKTVTPQAMAKLRELGVDQVVVPEELLTPLDARSFNMTLTRSFELDTPVPRTRALMADGILRAHVAASDNMTLNANRLLGDLAILYFDQPQLKRGAVLGLPSGGSIPKEFLDTLLAALGTSVPFETGGKSILSPATLDRLFAFAEPAGQNGGRGFTEGVARPEATLVRGWAHDPPGTLGSYKLQLSLARTSLAGYRSMLGLGEAGRLDHLELSLTVSAAAQFDPAQRQAYLDGAVEFVNSQAQGISVPEQQRVTLTSSDGQVPLILQSNLQYPVSARVTLTSDKVDFTGNDEFTTLLRPGANRIDLPIRSRSSGAFQVNVLVSSPDRVLPMSSGRLPIRSTAISGFGLGLTIGAGLFLAIWWARHFRQARRHQRLVRVDRHPSAAGARSQATLVDEQAPNPDQSEPSQPSAI